MSLVSVIIPAYNSQRFIEKAIISVINQTYTLWELIIIDDCSTDSTSDIVIAHSVRDNRIKYVKLEMNGGAGVARNKGIELAQGTYIAFLDSDDEWHPQKLEKQLDFMLENLCDFSYTDYFVVDGENEISIFKNKRDRICFNNELKFNYIACSTAIYNQVNLGKVYMPLYRNRQDWGLWLNLLRITDYAYCYNIPLTYYYVRKNSISSKKLKLINYHWLIYRNHLHKGFLLSLIYIANNLFLHAIASLRK